MECVSGKYGYGVSCLELQLTLSANSLLCYRTGLPPSGDGSDSDDSSEVEDEADEDSNGEVVQYSNIDLELIRRLCSAEDFYTNDYPDEESDGTGSSGWFLTPNSFFIRALKSSFVNCR